MKCNWCNKENIEPIDMHNDEMCDDCFDLSMEQEDIHIQIATEQKDRCFICNKQFTGSIVKEIDGAKRIVCWPSCDHAMNQNPPLRITFDMWNL